LLSNGIRWKPLASRKIGGNKYGEGFYHHVPLTDAASCKSQIYLAKS
jgi:hypothetical protein